MNNKKLGTAFEQEFCDWLAARGYWVHFITPDHTGSQPFDVIACKNGEPYAIDCKTCVQKKFNLSRLEDNQILAFKKWRECGNKNALIAIKHSNMIFVVDFAYLLYNKSVIIDDLKKAGEVFD